ncbi:hypothetical protein EVAR_26479_1 [Eumeta japonica]|uniref:Uncharacterized protein n=1 Tax=Eumeta variegata TaxID=151549 RepID=A0A4C1V8K9_EUMVA|nr:hypothetical protein EVAR_26479_1 [Eumeta japonica]
MGQNCHGGGLRGDKSFGTSSDSVLKDKRDYEPPMNGYLSRPWHRQPQRTSNPTKYYGYYEHVAGRSTTDIADKAM